MEKIQSDITKLNLSHYTSDFITQMKAIEDFEFEHKTHPSFDKHHINLIGLKGDAYQKNEMFDEAIIEFTKLAQISPNKSFNTQCIAACLVSLNREKEAANMITHQIAQETEPNSLLNLLYWYVMNISPEKENLELFQQKIADIIAGLGILPPNDNLSIEALIKDLKAQRMSADRRYNGFMSNINQLSVDDRKTSLKQFILDEPVGYFREMAKQALC